MSVVRMRRDPLCGVLAFGSLQWEPGELAALSRVSEVICSTPWPVEFARSSRSRHGAPTLVRVEQGQPVRARVLVYRNDPEIVKATLARREGIDLSRRPADVQPCEVAGVKLEPIWFTALEPNISDLRPEVLARLAIQSVRPSPERNGIRYLRECVEHGVVTQLSDAYRDHILSISGCGSLHEAENWAARQAPLSIVPQGWRWVRLGDVVLDSQAGFACGARDPNGIVQLRMNNVTSRGGFDWSTVVRVPPDSELVTTHGLRRGDVLFNNTNSTDLVGKTATFEGYVEPVVFSNHFTRLRPDPGALLPEFLSFWLQAKWQQGLFARICNRWVGQAAVQREKLLALEMPLPLLTEQGRIAAVLNERMAAVERARAAGEARLRAAQALPAAYLRATFDNPSARAWPRRHLGDLVRLRSEVLHPRDNPSGRATFVGLEHIESGTGHRIGDLEVEMAALTGRKPRFREGDIVYGYLRPYLNKVWIADFEGLCSVDQYVFSVDSSAARTEFVAWFMRSPVYLARAPIDLTPGQLPRIRTEEVFSVEIDLPPVDEQERLIARLAERMAWAQGARKAIEEELAAIEALPGALLREAFSGRL